MRARARTYVHLPERASGKDRRPRRDISRGGPPLYGGREAVWTAEEA